LSARPSIRAARRGRAVTQERERYASTRFSTAETAASSRTPANLRARQLAG
jgi:hypothetical protein